MVVTVNGQMKDVAPGVTLGALIAQLALNPKTVAVQRNGDIVPRDQFHAVCLDDGDIVEIIRFVGGG